MSHSDSAAGPILSEFASDPDMAELVDIFVGELPERIRAIESARSDRNYDIIARLAHQLKGAAPGYGFSGVGEAAASIEHRLRSAGGLNDSTKLAVDADVDRLLNMCRRVRAA